MHVDSQMWYLIALFLCVIFYFKWTHESEKMTGDQDGLRLRRAQSVTRAEEIQAEEQKVRKSQPDKP